MSMSLFAQANVSDISSMPGAFSRMGFGARGMGMGNALSAVTEGDLVAYYNPALSVYQQGNSFSSSYSILALDRSLNFIDFTRRFDFGQKTNSDGSTSPRSTAGISIGLINSGVSNIDAEMMRVLKPAHYQLLKICSLLQLLTAFHKSYLLDSHLSSTIISCIRILLPPVWDLMLGPFINSTNP